MSPGGPGFNPQSGHFSYADINPGTTLTQDQCPQSPDEVEEMRSVPYISAVGSLYQLWKLTHSKMQKS